MKATWGSEWKKAALHYYDRTGSIVFQASTSPIRGNYMDLDPVYKDHFGDPSASFHARLARERAQDG